MGLHFLFVAKTVSTHTNSSKTPTQYHKTHKYLLPWTLANAFCKQCIKHSKTLPKLTGLSPKITPLLQSLWLKFKAVIFFWRSQLQDHSSCGHGWCHLLQLLSAAKELGCQWSCSLPHIAPHGGAGIAVRCVLLSGRWLFETGSTVSLGPLLLVPSSLTCLCIYLQLLPDNRVVCPLAVTGLVYQFWDFADSVSFWFILPSFTVMCR